MFNTIWEDIKSAWAKEWTAFWGWTKVTVGAFVAAAPVITHGIGSILNEPKVQSALDQLHLDPKIGLGLATLGVITLMSMEHA